MRATTHGRFTHIPIGYWENYYQHFQKITITNIILSENYCRTSLCLRLRRNLSPKLFAYISSEHVIDIPFRLRYNDLCCSLMVYILRIQVWAWLQRFLILYIRRHDWQQRSIYISCTRNCTYKNSYMSPILLIWTCICNSRNWWHIVFKIKTSHNYRGVSLITAISYIVHQKTWLTAKINIYSCTRNCTYRISYVPNISHMDSHMQLTKLMAYRLWN